MCTAEGADRYETGTNVTRTTKNTITNLLLSIMTPNILSRTNKWIAYIWFHIDWFDWFYNKERRWHRWQHLWKARNDACFCPFCLNLTSFPTFLTLQDKQIHLYSLRNRPEKLTEGSLFCLFLKLVRINFIFTDNVRILYMYVCHICFISIIIVLTWMLVVSWDLLLWNFIITLNIVVEIIICVQFMQLN